MGSRNRRNRSSDDSGFDELKIATWRFHSCGATYVFAE